MNNIPQPYKTETVTYDFHEVEEYINWIYFFHSWNFPPRFSTIAQTDNCPACRNSWIGQFDNDDCEKAKEAVKLYNDALKTLRENNGKYKLKLRYSLFHANSDNDDVVIDDCYRIPFLRQQKPDRESKYCLCLADYIRPYNDAGIKDTIGVFACTIDESIQEAYPEDEYLRMMIHILAERLVEAAIEKSHEYIRKQGWGYCKDENMTIRQLLNEEYDGIRPAVGYPSIPDHTINFIIRDLLKVGEIGLTITENGAMYPPASVSGFIFSNPNAKYFSIGRISEEQLMDYSKRRGIDHNVLKKFLSKNLIGL